MTMMAPLAAALALLLLPAAGLAQQTGAPLPLYPGAAPPPIKAEPLPPPATPALQAAPAPAATTTGAPAMVPPPPAAIGNTRVFCEQAVSARLGDRDAVPERYRKFIGIWSDAAWTPSLCAALIVANVTPDGTASILYVFGPLGSSRPPGGVLRGTGIIRDGELKFQNSDGSQFAFRPLYADLQGHLTTPKGTTYEAIFKQTP
jgi:hypothetical protein